MSFAKSILTLPHIFFSCIMPHLQNLLATIHTRRTWHKCDGARVIDAGSLSSNPGRVPPKSGKMPVQPSPALMVGLSESFVRGAAIGLPAAFTAKVAVWPGEDSPRRLQVTKGSAKWLY